MADSKRSITRDVSVGNGVVAGTLAYALGYVLTYLWQSDSVRESLQGYNAVIDFFGGDPCRSGRRSGGCSTTPTTSP